MRRIAPPDPPGLLDRDAELAELADFCLRPDRGPYLWWRAGPWAGKSALLSTFVLHPPARIRDRVRIVSFFITARLAAQDTRETFTEVLLDQLTEMIGEHRPPPLSEDVRDAYLLDTIARAAEDCRAAGRRLVLVVDGLDEERGAIPGPLTHSIAGLLPPDPPAGMRVIVAGRPNPPIPDDVPGFHPLRAPETIRPLSDSPHARDIRRLGHGELSRLLRQGNQVEQDVLGVLTAARGGLSLLDLRDLVDTDLLAIENVLHAVDGRTFTRRLSTWTDGTPAEVYLLGHEELQSAAADYLGERRLAGYRERLHAWHEHHRDRGWLPGTPEYLLDGYSRLLLSTGDLPRLIACATDAARQDRMLELTGGDTLALNEIRSTVELIATQDTPDLASALCLVHQRERLTDRNRNIPVRLPAVWVAVGQVERAGQLAMSISDPARRQEALVLATRTLIRLGLVAEAERIARSIADPRRRAGALAEVVGAGNGQSGPDRTAVAGKAGTAGTAGELAAESRSGFGSGPAFGRGPGGEGGGVPAADSMSDPGQRAEAFAAVAGAYAEDQQPEQASALAIRAEQSAREVSNPHRKAQTLAEVVAALAEAGQHTLAHDVACSISDPGWQARALAEVACALVRAGEDGRAVAVVAGIADAGQRSRALAEVAAALIQAGKPDEAEQATWSIPDESLLVGTLARVVDALVRVGRRERAGTVAGRAATLARRIDDPLRRAHALAMGAGALARAGLHEPALELARSIADRHRRASALAEIACALVDDGQDRQVSRVVRAIDDPWRRSEALAEVAAALARAGRYPRARAAARLLDNLDLRARVLARVAAGLARAGQPEHGLPVAREAARTAGALADLEVQARALAGVAVCLAEAGPPLGAVTVEVAHDAVRAAHAISNQDRLAEVLAEVAGTLVRVGQVGEAQRLARSITDPDSQAWALAEVASVLARAGEVVEARRLARSIADGYRQARALAEVVGALVAARDHAQAEEVARSIADAQRRAEVLADVTGALAREGDVRAARRTAMAACLVGSFPTAVRAVLRAAPETSPPAW